MHMLRVIYAIPLCLGLVITLVTGAIAAEQTRASGQPQALDRKTADHARYS